MSDSLRPHGLYLPGSSIHGIFQARLLKWSVISFSRGSSWPRDWTQVSCLAGRCFTVWTTREAKWKWKSLSPVWIFATPWTVVHGVLQARRLEQVLFSLLQQIFPTQESNWALLHCRQILYRLSYQGSSERREWQLTPVFLPGESHGQKSLVGHSP